MKPPRTQETLIQPSRGGVSAAFTQVVVAHGKGWLERRQGLLVLHVVGTPWEMGEQHGVLLRVHVRGTVA